MMLNPSSLLVVLALLLDIIPISGPPRLWLADNTRQALPQPRVSLAQYAKWSLPHNGRMAPRPVRILLFVSIRPTLCGR